MGRPSGGKNKRYSIDEKLKIRSSYHGIAINNNNSRYLLNINLFCNSSKYYEYIKIRSVY